MGKAVVIGAGHAGLAASNLLTAQGIDHTVLDRDGVASTWRNERWDSFCLLTPNWATWLPNWAYHGADPHGFMGRDEIVDYFTRYAGSFSAPVETGVEVTKLESALGGGFALTTSDGSRHADAVIVATGPFQSPKTPEWSARVPAGVTQLHSRHYRSAAELPPGAVLVVGSGPSAQQIAEDLLLADRPVYLAVGRHRRVPRRYRGRDYYWWLELGGWYEKVAEDVPLARRRDSVAPALTGAHGVHDLDLRGLAARGAHLLGRATGFEDGNVHLAGNLLDDLTIGDAAYDDFTSWVESRLYRFDGMYDDVEGRETFPDPPPSPELLDLAAAGVTSVVWATGFRLDFARWVDVPVLDDSGHPVHTRGVTEVPGLYFLGLSWLHRLRSPFIRGAEEDASHITRHLAATMA